MITFSERHLNNSRSLVKNLPPHLAPLLLDSGVDARKENLRLTKTKRIPRRQAPITFFEALLFFVLIGFATLVEAPNLMKSHTFGESSERIRSFLTSKLQKLPATEHTKHSNV